ncbi:MAG: hypothetical protein J6B87_00015 [Clostridia bacterium]|nr:hypothetical protein [Clostridia bacterium]
MKFIWQSGDVKVTRIQCETCKYYSKGAKNSCEKYAEIPKEILESKKKCEYIKFGNEPW